jgi:actin-like ATPase involved in cell morphogenesis
MTAQEPAPILGVDFGDGAIVCGSMLQDGHGFFTHASPGWSQETEGTEPSMPVHRVPTLIRYRNGETPDIGDEVIRGGFADHPSTVRWIRSYLLEESGALIAAGDEQRITFRDAACDFLGAVLEKNVNGHKNIRSVVFSVPEDAPHWYGDWLAKIAHTAGMNACHTITECSAAAAGYGLDVGTGEVFFLFSCDETELILRIARNNGSMDSAETEVIGSARADTGSGTLDGWIAQEIMAKSHLAVYGNQGKIRYNTALACVSRVFQSLVGNHETVVEFSDPVSIRPVAVRITADDIVRVFSNNGLPAILDDVIRRARGMALARGYVESAPAAVLMIGRGSMLPAVQALIRERFSEIPVLSDHPLDAIARGACLFRPHRSGSDRIRNNYALRYWDPASREHRYRFLVHSGARFPSAGQVARITISAAYDGQARLGLSLYEIGGDGGGTAPSLELVQDHAGGVRLAAPEKDADEGSRPRLVNGTMPTLLSADPPGVKGEPRFELIFIIDRERRLCLTARDLVTGKLVKRDAPVYRLT